MAGPWEAYQSTAERGPWESYAAPTSGPERGTALAKTLGVPYDIVMGGLRGAANIGATILTPVDMLMGKTDRRQQLDDFFKEKADTGSLAFKAGELGTEIAGTAGVGGALAKVAKFAPRFAAALESGGLKIGESTGSKLADMGIRAAGGATVGGASAGLVDPDSFGAGAIIGGALPGAVKAAGAVGKSLAPKKASEEVAALYGRAQELGIDIPADRITNSRPMNALASSLNYVPFSGRAETEATMFNQFNKAISKTFGQDSENVAGALRKANLELGTKFEQTLSNNGVWMDDALKQDLAKNMQMAADELDEAGAKIIGKQIDSIMEKAKDGVIDGQAAYNIKKTLDRIGGRNSNEAFYARELKKSLMGALDRSLGPKEAEAFKKLRQQYGNMLDVESVAQRGAEGGVSIGKLANVGRTNNKDLDELADIAAQFLKTRESPHGAAQRVVLGTGAAAVGLGTGTLPAIGAGIVGARGANALLNSEGVKNALLRQGPGRNRLAELAANPTLRSLAYISQATP